jgi:D-alanyl-D-alanine carboxypeptidase
VVAASRGVTAASATAPQASPTTKLGAAVQTLTAPMVQLQILESPAPPPAPGAPAAPATKNLSKVQARRLRLAAATPPQLKPPSAENIGIVAGVPLATNADRGWGIQVGAYTRYSPARQVAIKAQQNLPVGMPPTRIAVDEGGGRLYRARLVGFAESEATEACRTLKAQEMSCLVVQSNLAVAQSPAQ